MSPTMQQQICLSRQPVSIQERECPECSDSISPASKRLRLSPNSHNSSNEFLDEQLLRFISKATNWNPFLLCLLSGVCRKLNAIVKRVLWKEFCRSRAPKMVSDLLNGTRNGHIDGGWQALGKLLLHCAGCHATKNFQVKTVPGHIVHMTRFSRTSGKSFLIPQCRSDVLYVTDLCEHEDDEEDVGLFRGVFPRFEKSKTRRLLTDRRVELDDKEMCPFCRAKVWSMSTAKMIPKSASRRLAAYNENVEYFICLNGHMNGKCSLLPLSDSEDSCDENG